MNSRTTYWGIIACYFLALTCLAIAIHQTSILLTLVREGKLADAEVVGIEAGVKGGKRAVLQFVTDTGSSTVSRDLFQMMVIRFHKGDHVTVLYSPSNAGIATIYLGLWTWQEPAFLFFGFVFLSILGLLLPRFKPVHNM